MKVLICGGRHFTDTAFVWTMLDRLHTEAPFTAIMQGGADGADYLANEWAKTKPEVQRYVCKADWKKYPKAAGPIRNARMLEWKPDLVVAFPGSKGTADMVRRAREAGVEVREFQ
jgi:hypothetical protein